MRSEYPGYYQKSKEELTALLEGATIVFDTNVLLNILKTESSAAEALVEHLEQLRDEGRLWLPRQVADEYHKNLHSVLRNEIKGCDGFVRSLSGIKTSVQSSGRFPHLDPDFEGRFNKFISELESEVKRQKSELKSNMMDVASRIAKAYEGKLGEMYSGEKLSELEQQGKERYQKQIPPGYKDKGKDQNRYGDYILWTQMIAWSRSRVEASEQAAVIFVTSDQKEDWWDKSDGLNFGPHPLLVQEFIDKVGHGDFHMYSMSAYLEYTQVGKGVVEAVERVSVPERKEDEGILSSAVNNLLSIVENNDRTAREIGLRLSKADEYRSKLSRLLVLCREFDVQYDEFKSLIVHHSISPACWVLVHEPIYRFLVEGRYIEPDLDEYSMSDIESSIVELQGLTRLILSL